MKTIECRVETGAAPEALWRIWSDVANWPRWDHGIEWARLGGPFDGGTTGRLKPNGGPEVPFVLLWTNPQEGFSDESRLPLGRLRFEHRWRPLENGRVEFVHRVGFHGPLGFLYAFLMGPSFRRDLPKAMETLARMAERDGQ